MINTLTNKLMIDKINFASVRNVVVLYIGSEIGDIKTLRELFRNSSIHIIEHEESFINNILELHGNDSQVIITKACVGDSVRTGFLFRYYKNNELIILNNRNQGFRRSYDKKLHNECIETGFTTLSNVLLNLHIEKVNLLIIHACGLEIDILKGYNEKIVKSDYLWIELLKTNIFLDQTNTSELDNLLKGKDFELIASDKNEYIQCFLYRRKYLKIVFEEDLILHQPWGGLGDNLQFSTLPELAALNNRKFFISNENVYRNNEIENLVWASNPFVNGISSHEINSGSIKGLGGTASGTPFIQRIELAHRFKSKNLYPKIYRKYNNIPELNQKILIDLSATGNGGGSSEEIKIFMLNLLTEGIIDRDNAFQVSFTNYEENNNLFIEGFNVAMCHSISHYCDLIYSCSKFITVHSGAHSLASAIKTVDGSSLNNIHCCVPKNQFNSGVYIFSNVRYFITS